MNVVQMWRVWRAYRKGRKKMSMLSKAIESRTTQTVAGSTFAGGGAAVALLAFLRSTWPALIPWEETRDPEVVVGVATVVVPLVSRLIAWARGKV